MVSLIVESVFHFYCCQKKWLNTKQLSVQQKAVIYFFLPFEADRTTAAGRAAGLEGGVLLLLATGVFAVRAGLVGRLAGFFVDR